MSDWAIVTDMTYNWPQASGTSLWNSEKRIQGKRLSYVEIDMIVEIDDTFLH